MALDVGFEVTPSNSLEGQIEVASSNDLGGRGLERPRRSRPRTTSSGSLKYEEVIILQTGYRTINGYFRHSPTYFRSVNGRYKQYPVTSGNTIANRGHIRSLPVPLDKSIIFMATSGLRPRTTSEVTEVNNLEVTE